MAQPGRRSGAVAEQLGAARVEIGEATAQREQAERVALESQLQQIREQSQEREAELSALRAQLAASEEAEKKGR